MIAVRDDEPPPFLARGGRMGVRIAAHDWSATPLGPLHLWPGALKTAAGLALSSRFPTFLTWGPEFVALYNDAYEPLLGIKPDALGRPFREIWSEVWSDLGPIAERALAGEASYFENLPLVMERNGYPEETWWTFSYSPAPCEDGSVGGVLCTVHETTAAVRSQRRQAFLLDLESRIREQVDPRGVMDAAVEALALHLGLDRVGYGRVGENGAALVLESSYAADGAPLPRAVPLAAFAPDGVTRLKQGRIQASGDVLADPARRLDTWAVAGVRAFVAAPLVRDGRLLGVLYAIQRQPRRWTPEILSLIEDVAARTWEAAARARAEIAQRKAGAQLSLALQAGRLAEVTFELDTDGLRHSPAFAELLGHPSGRKLDLSDLRARYHPEDADRVIAERAAILDGGQLFYDVDHRIVRPDSEVRWLYARGRVNRDADGRPRSVTAVYLDETERTRALLQLKESERRFELARRAAGIGVWEWDQFTGEISWSAEIYALTGLDPTLHPAKRREAWDALLHPEDSDRVLTIIAQALAKAEPFVCDFRIVRADTSEVRWLRSQAAVVRAPDGTAAKLTGINLDVTAEHLMEASLREQNDQLAGLVESRTRERDRIWSLAPDLMCVARADTTLLSVNPAWERLLGWTPEQLVGHKAGGFKHPDDAGRTRRALESLAPGTPVMNFEDRYRTSGGDWRWISWTVQLEDGLMYCVGRDVTRERETRDALATAEEARRKADALYRAYFANTAEGLFVVAVGEDGGFSLEALNPAHEASTGLNMEALRGLPLERQLPPDVAEAVSANYRRAVEEGAPVSYREVVTLDGVTRHWDTVLAPVRGVEGRIERIIGSSRDVTAQVQAEDRLRQSQKMEAVGQLTGGIAHDFNNLLGAVVGGFDLIRRKPEDVERVKRFAEAGLQAAERGAKLTGQLLAFSRSQRIELRPVDISMVVHGMRELLAGTVGPMVRLDLRLDGELPPVLSDTTQLEMAVLNLAINARDAMEGGGVITVAARERRIDDDPELAPADYVELSVTDTGGGMPPDVLARAFDPFFTTKGVGRGTGLGLSQVYGIASQAGGAARIESRPGEGTTVRLLLPQTTAPAGAEDAAAASEASAGQPSALILLVDDDADVRAMAAASLEALGYQVVTAEDGPAGLELLDRLSPHLLMVDFAMPGMNGAEVARAARRRAPDMPIVFASGYSDTAAIEAAAGPGADLLRKPFRMDELQRVIARALTRSAAPAKSVAALRR